MIEALFGDLQFEFKLIVAFLCRNIFFKILFIQASEVRQQKEIWHFVHDKKTSKVRCYSLKVAFTILDGINRH